MRFSTEKEIVRYPAGEETGHLPETVSNIGFLQYNLGGGVLVWRSPDQSAEVGQRGGGGTYYVKFSGVMVVASFSTLRGALRLAASMLPPNPTPYADPRFITARN